MSERECYRIWTEERWLWRVQGRNTRAVCRRFTRPRAYVTAGWLSARDADTYIVEEPNGDVVYVKQGELL